MKKLSNVFKEVFDNEELEIGYETSAKDIEDWDSLINLQLMIATEKACNVNFTAFEISKFKNVGDMCESIIKKGGEV